MLFVNHSFSFSLYLSFLLIAISLPASIAAENIKMELTTHMGDVTRFHSGDNVSFLLNLSSDAYLLVLYENANKELVQLLPNKKRPDFFLPAGIFLPIPDKTAPFVFHIQKPFGNEQLVILASDNKLPDIPGEWNSDGSKTLSMKLGKIRQQVQTGSGDAFGEVSYRLVTQP